MHIVTERVFTDHAMTRSSGAWERPSVSRRLRALGECLAMVPLSGRGNIYEAAPGRAVHRYCITKLLVTNISTPASSTALHTILHPAPSTTIPTTPHSPQQPSPPTRPRHRLNSLEAAVPPLRSLPHASSSAHEASCDASHRPVSHTRTQPYSDHGPVHCSGPGQLPPSSVRLDHHLEPPSRRLQWAALSVTTLESDRHATTTSTPARNHIASWGTRPGCRHARPVLQQPQGCWRAAPVAQHDARFCHGRVSHATPALSRYKHPLPPRRPAISAARRVPHPGERP